MKRIVLSLGILLVGAILFACAPKSVPPEKIPTSEVLSLAGQIVGKESWQVEWERTLAEARKEGKVNIYSFLGTRMREELGKAFKAKFGLDIEWTPGSGSALAQKTLSERSAGLYLPDLFLSGATDHIATMKPRGALDPLWPELLLPEVTDTSKWLNNSLPWVDKDRYVLAPAQTPSSNTLINLDRVSTDELASYKNYLNPKWKGRIVTLNPTIPGSPAKWMSVLGMEIMGTDYIRELAKQEMVIVGDKRTPVEWVARGKADIAIAPAAEIITEFVDAGVKNLKILTPKEGGYQSAGSSTISVINRRPHPNATRVFLNWYLSREGQQLFAIYDWRQGTRLDIIVDVNRFPPEKIRQPGVKYLYVETEEFLSREKMFIETLKEIFGPYMR